MKCSTRPDVGRPFKLTYPDPAEDSIHEAVAKLLWVALPDDVWWSTIEHRNAKDAREGAMRKARGVKPGVPDILLCYGGALYCIEMKTRTGTLSPAQKDRRIELKRAGAHWAICRSVDDVIRQLRAWGIPINARIMG